MVACENWMNSARSRLLVSVELFGAVVVGETDSSSGGRVVLMFLSSGSRVEELLSSAVSMVVGD